LGGQGGAEGGPGGEGGGGGSLVTLLAATEYQVSASTSRPTAIQARTVDLLRGRLSGLIGTVNGMIGTEFTPLYRKVVGKDPAPAIALLKPLAN
jgi:hypothetical protein